METSQRVSPNRLEGSLTDVGLERLLAACRRQLVTGTIDVVGGGRHGAIELRLGGVESAAFDVRSGDDALAAIGDLVDGTYELVQRLPDVDGSLGSAAELRAEGGNVTLVDIMRHCEHHALSCTITALADYDVGTVTYRSGDVVDVTLNGRNDDDAIVDMARWRGAKYRVAAPPLALDIDGWPVAGRAKTEPFVFRAGCVDVVPPVRRRRAPTYAPTQREPQRSRWRDVMWNCVASAVGKLGERTRVRAGASPARTDEPAARPTRRARVRGFVGRVRRAVGRRLARA